MTRIAIIGNSHVGPYKRAWDVVRDRWPGVTIDFFAAPGANFSHLALTGGRYLAPRAGLSAGEDRRVRGVLTRVNGRTEIDLGPAEHVLWVGAGHDIDGTTFEAVGDLLGAVVVDGIPRKPRAPGKTAPVRLSRPALDAALAALAARLVPGPAWRGWAPGRLLFSPLHRPADDVLRLDSPLGARWRRFVRAGEAGRRGLDLYAGALEAQLAPLGIAMFHQPPATIGRHGLTRGELTRGSLFFSGRPHVAEDVYHMNLDFGLIVLAALFERLGLAEPSTGEAAARAVGHATGHAAGRAGVAADPALV